MATPAGFTEAYSVDFDSDAKVNKFFYSPAPDGLANADPVARSVVDGVSCIDINIGDELPDIAFHSTVVSGSMVDAYTKMTADLAHAAGTIADCYSHTSTNHGRYEKLLGSGTGSWSRIGPANAPLVADENHRRTAQLLLTLQSWSMAADPYAPNDDVGPFIDKMGYPDIPDIRGSILRWRMRAIGMSMGINVKLWQHFQTRVPRMPDGPDYGDGDAVAFVNALNTGCIPSDPLGFGSNGPFVPNACDYVHDSGWVDIDIPLEGKDSYWLALGGVPGKMGREPYEHTLRYVCAPAAEWTADWTGNAYLVFAMLNTAPGTDMAVIPEEDAPKGRLLISGFKWFTPI